jgi:autotransporter-associated beta strand protein
MSFAFRSLFPRVRRRRAAGRQSAPRGTRLRPVVEQLEDRLSPSTTTLTITNGVVTGGASGGNAIPYSVTSGEQVEFIAKVTSTNPNEPSTGGVNAVYDTGHFGNLFPVNGQQTILETAGLDFAPSAAGVSLSGNLNLFATDSSINGTLTLIAPATDSAAFTVPGSGTAGQALSPAVTVNVLSPQGGLDFSLNGQTMTLTLNSTNGATVSGNTATISGSQATFPNLTVNQAGQGDTLTAAVGGVTLGTSGPFNVAAQGQTLTWDGKGDGINWSDPKNWVGNQAPQSPPAGQLGETLVFPDTTAPKETRNNIPSASLSSLQAIQVQGSGYDLTGNALTVTGGVTTSGGSNLYEIPTTLGPGATFSAGVAADDTLTVTAPLSGAGGLVVTGPGTVDLAKDNSYGGGTKLSGGTLAIHSAGALGTGTLELDGGTLKNASGQKLALANPVTLNGATVIDLGDGGSLGFDNKIQVNSASTLTVQGTGKLGFLAGSMLAGTAILTLQGTGNVQMLGEVAAPVVTAGTVHVTLAGKLDAPGVMVTGSSIVFLGLPPNLRGIINLDFLNGSGPVSVQGGTVVGEGNADFQGNVTLTSGTVVIRNGSDPLGTGNLTLQSGTLRSSGGGTVTNPLTLAGNVELRSPVASPLVFSKPVTLTGSSTVTVGGVGARTGLNFQKGFLPGGHVTFTGNGTVVSTPKPPASQVTTGFGITLI